MAVAGIHGRGGSHIDAFTKMKGCTVTHLIDPDSSMFPSKAAGVEKKTGKKPKCVQDIRKALEDKDIDAVSVATCNHWHSLITIWSCQAGKDVYVEKPCSHNVFEGRKCVEAARKYNRIVQHGTQSRSSNVANVVAAIQSGKYGKLLIAKAYCCKPRWSIGFKPIEAPPTSLDFDIWLGPAPKQPYHKNLVHYNWHWFWDTGNGDMGNQGVHQMDIARWGLGATLPNSVISLGCRYVNEKDFKDQGQTPNLELCIYDFNGTLLVFETRGLVAKKNKEGKDPFPFKVANDWYLEAGKIVGDKFYPKGKDKGEPLPAPAKKGKSRTGDHFANFIAAIRSRKPSDLNAEIEEGHYSSALCHLGNISYRLGKPVPFSQKPKDLPENEQVAASIKDIQENLKGALGMDLDKYTYQIGPKLTFDPKTEKFVGCPEADKLLTRTPRPPFAVPEKV